MNQREERRICNALVTPIVVLTGQYFVLVSFQLMGTVMDARVRLFSKAVVGLVYLSALTKVLRRNLFRFIAVYWTSVFIFSCHYFMFPANQAQMRLIFFDLFLISLPTFLYSLAVEDYGVLRRSFDHAATMVMVLGVLLAGQVFTGRATVGSYSMSLSYYMLLPALIYLDKVIDRFRLKEFILFVVSLFIIVALGARGPVMCIAVFLVLKMFRGKSWSIGRMLGHAMQVGVVISIAVNWNKILEILHRLFFRYGVHSRTIDMFLRGTAHVSYSRRRIFGTVWAEIARRPLFGIGLAGDRKILEGSNAYVHNFFLEILGNFGIVVGSFFLIVVVAVVIRALRTQCLQLYNLVAILFSVGVVPLMVSGSYISSIFFWLFMGVALGLLADGNQDGTQNRTPA